VVTNSKDEYPVVYLSGTGIDRNHAKRDAIYYLGLLRSEPAHDSGHEDSLRRLKGSLEAAALSLQDIGGCDWSELEAQIRKFHAIKAKYYLDVARDRTRERMPFLQFGRIMSVSSFKHHCEALGLSLECFGTDESELDQIVEQCWASIRAAKKAKEERSMHKVATN